MKLTLLILLLIGVVSATQDLSGSEAVHDLVSIEDATEKEAPSLRALRRECNYFRSFNTCGKKYRCNKSNSCVLKRKYKYGGGHRTGKDYYYYGYEGLNRDIGKYCTRNRQCRGDLLRCNTSRDRCELK
eukprot:scaffold1966_cov131-Skeletonema_marinoi.AAC.1